GRVKAALARNVDPNTVDVETAADTFGLNGDSRERLRRLFEQSDELQYSGAHNGSETITAENRRDVLELIEHLRTRIREKIVAQASSLAKPSGHPSEDARATLSSFAARFLLRRRLRNQRPTLQRRTRITHRAISRKRSPVTKLLSAPDNGAPICFMISAT